MRRRSSFYHLAVEVGLGGTQGALEDGDGAAQEEEGDARREASDEPREGWRGSGGNGAWTVA